MDDIGERSRVAALTVAALALLLAASEASAQQRRQERGQARDATIGLTVVNRAAPRIQNLHVTPADSLSWGADRLGSDTVEPGARKTLRIERVPGCRYDVRVIYGDGAVDLETDVNLCAAPVLTLSGDRSVSPLRLVRLAARRPVALFLVTNKTGVEMEKLIVGTTSQLDGSTVDPDDRTVGRFRPAEGCKVNLSAEFKEGDSTFLKDHDLCAMPVVTFSQFAETTPVRFRNASAYPLASLYVRPVGFESWGSDRLGSSILQPRDVKTIRIPAQAAGSSCLHDVKASFSGAAEDEVRMAVDLCRPGVISVDGPELVTGKGDRKAAAAQQAVRQTLSVTVRNESSRTIREVFLSATSAREWGDNRMVRTLAPGEAETLSIDQGETCLFDVKAVYEGGREQRRLNQDLCRSGGLAFGGALTKLIDGGGPETGFRASMINAGNGPIQSLHLTPSSDTHWGDDRLGSNSLERNSRFEIRLPRAGGCFWDIKIGYSRDAVDERRRVNLCDAPEQKLRQTPKPGTVISTGTGFFISAAGHVMTNAHVVEGCRVVQAPRDGQPPLLLKVLKEDEDSDLAILKADLADTPFIRLRRPPAAPLRSGERAIVVGYPVRSKLGVVNVTEGIVSAAGRSGQDPTRLQFTAPVQPGNSGGPVLDSHGQAIGVVVSRLGQLDEQMTQNVNFAVSIAAVEALLKEAAIALPETSATDAPLEPRGTPDIFEQANAAVLPLDCLE